MQPWCSLLILSLSPVSPLLNQKAILSQHEACKNQVQESGGCTD